MGSTDERSRRDDAVGDAQSNAANNAANNQVREAGHIKQGTGFFSVVKSVMAAGFGVQSGENRERDFTQGKASHFIVGGLIGTLLFVLLIVMVVKLLLANT